MRRVYTQMIEQRQVGERPKRHESGPVHKNAADRNVCGRNRRCFGGTTIC